MAKKPNISYLYNFEVCINDYDLVLDLEVYEDDDSANITVYDVKLDAPELFNKDYIMEYLESECQEQLYEALHENDYQCQKEAKEQYLADQKD